MTDKIDQAEDGPYGGHRIDPKVARAQKLREAYDTLMEAQKLREDDQLMADLRKWIGVETCEAAHLLDTLPKD